jgi:hypothetical protein
VPPDQRPHRAGRTVGELAPGLRSITVGPDRLATDGYRFVTVSELLALR